MHNALSAILAIMKVRMIEGTTADALAETARAAAAGAVLAAVLAGMAFALMESGWRYAVGGVLLLMALIGAGQAADTFYKGAIAGMLAVHPWGNVASAVVIGAGILAMFAVDSVLARVGLGIVALLLVGLTQAIACRPKED